MEFRFLVLGTTLETVIAKQCFIAGTTSKRTNIIITVCFLGPKCLFRLDPTSYIL